MRGRKAAAFARPAGGFTLVEILIVIAVLGILATLALDYLPSARNQANRTVAVVDINALTGAVEHYAEDEGEYPGERVRSGEVNQFPLLYRALFGERRPQGPGGRNAPYMTLKAEKIAVYDEDIDGYRPAKRSELRDPDVEKFLLDAWGNPLVYRVNKGRPLQVYMYNRHRFDLYSTGPDGIDQTTLGEDGGDDVGNW